MTVTLESTTKLVDLVVNGARVPARVWEGRTAAGVPCHAFITLLAAEPGADHAEFDRDLLEQRAPSPAVARYPAAIAL